MDMQRARTILIATLTAASGLMMFVPVYATAFCSESVDNWVSTHIYCWGSLAVFPFAVLVLIAMWGWNASFGWKISILIFHMLFGCIAFAGLFICFPFAP